MNRKRERGGQRSCPSFNLRSVIVCRSFLATNVSYLVCVDVSGAVAPSTVVITKITQKPPRQTREVPLVEGNV